MALYHVTAALDYTGITQGEQQLDEVEANTDGFCFAISYPGYNTVT